MTMLGSSCSPCCQQGQGQGPCPCVTGSLPETVTVVLEGTGREPGPNLLGLSITSCFGSGATGAVDAPGGDSTGPISSATVTNGGSGYAIYGRAAPTLSVANASTTPATATVHTTLATDNCGRPHYAISGVTVTNGGDGYANGQSLQIGLGVGDVQETSVQATIFTTRAEPTLLAETSSSGEGVEFTVTVQSNQDSPETWSVASVTAAGDPVGFVPQYLTIYSDDPAVVEGSAAQVKVSVPRAEPVFDEFQTFSGIGYGVLLNVTTSTNGSGENQTWSLASATVVEGGSLYAVGDFLIAITSAGVNIEDQDGFFGVFIVTAIDVEEERGEPAYDSFPSVTGTGSGAVLGVELSQTNASPPTWIAVAASVSEAGSGYAVDDLIEAVPSAGVVISQALFSVAEIDENGAALSVTLVTNGEAYGTEGTEYGAVTGVSVVEGRAGLYYGFGDEIESITVESGGAYYKPSGTLAGITIANGGKYYRPDPTLTPVISAISATVTQPILGVGVGAVITAAVNTNTASPSFGSITGLTVTNGGSGYKSYNWDYSCDCEWLADEEPGASHSVVCWRYYPFDVFHGELTPTCFYVAPRCYPAVAPNQTSASLLRVRIQSPIKTAWVGLIGIVGVPGRDGGAIQGLAPDAGELLQGWATTVDGEVYAPAVTATIEQAFPSQGSGAAVSASINVNPNSEDFGDLSLTLTSGGSGYLGGWAGSDTVQVEHRGPSLPPRVYASDSDAGRLGTGLACVTTYEAAEPITDCGDFSFVASFGDATATVSPGGEPTPLFRGSNKCCGECYNCCPERPSQVTITFRREANEGFTFLTDDNQDYITNPFNISGYGWITEATDSWRTNCPEHEVEVVFDLDDIEQNRVCPGALVACVGDTAGTQNDLILCNTAAHAAASLDVILDPDTPLPVTNGFQGYSDRIFKHQRAEKTAALCSLEIFSTLAGTGTNYFDRNTNQNCLLSIQITKRNFWQSVVAEEPVGDGDSHPSLEHRAIYRVGRKVVYTLQESEDCASFPGGWDDAETITVSEGEGYIGADEVYGKQFVTVATGVGPLFRFIKLRRICNDYEIDVEFS